MKYKVTILAFAFLILVSNLTFAESDEIMTAKLNGNVLEFDVPPIVIQDRTMVPFRGIMESLGLDIQWNDETKTIIAHNKQTTFLLTVGQEIAVVNGENVRLDVAPIILNDRTLVPLRFISEKTGANVKWDKEINTVFINQYPLLFPLHEELIPYHSKTSYINDKGEVVISQRSGYGFEFINGYSEISFEDQSDGEDYFFDVNGKTVDSTTAEMMQNTAEGVAIVQNQDNYCWYLMDLNGVRHDFSENIRFYSSLEVHEPKRVKGSVSSEGLICYSENSLYGYMDRYANVLIQPQYFEAGSFSDGLAYVTADNGKRGYINHAGKFVISPEFEDASEFSNGLAKVKQNGKYGYIDKTGKFIIEAIYMDCNDFSEGLAAVCIDWNWGYVNTKGDVVINLQYRNASDFSEGLAIIDNGNNIQGSSRFIDKNGNFVLSDKFCDLHNFTNGVALVDISEPGFNGKYFSYTECYINKQGEILASAVRNTI